MKNLFWMSLVLGLLFTVVTPSSVEAAVTFNRSAAIAWAQANNRNDGVAYGSSQGRYCTNYIARAWNAGGLNVPTTWIGNGQIVSWMLNNPNSWEFLSLDQLVAGDIVLYSDNAGAPSNWSYLNSAGASLWLHSALVVAPGRVAAWNSERWDVPITQMTPSYIYRVGVHIKDESTPAPPPYAHQGSLSYGSTQVKRLDGEHRWHIRVQSGHAPVMFDLDRRSGNGGYRVILKKSTGEWIVDTRSSVNGRAIVSYPSPSNEDLYLHIIPDDGVAIDYSVTAWATSIPRIAYEWEYQDAYYDRNTSRWQAYVGSSDTNFYVNFERYSGDLEIQWRLQTRTGTVLATGTSAGGRVIAPGRAQDWVDFYITSATGSGSYRISLRNGIPNPGIPRLLAPTSGTIVDSNFVVQIEPGPGNGRGNPDWHLQIDNNSNFSSPEFDNGTDWSSSPNIPVQLGSAGEYWLRVRQGDGIDRSSGFSAPVKFEVQSSSEFEIITAVSHSSIGVGDGTRVDFVISHPELAPGGGIRGLDLACNVSQPLINGVEVINGSAFGSDSVSVLLSSPAFAPLPAFQWLTSLREDTASVTEDGTAVTVSYVGAVEGTTELICTADAISATGTLIESVPVTGATIEVVGNGTITGIVTLEEATNHTGIVVILTDENGTPVTTATTAADGAFSFTVEPGSYFVRADADGYVTVASEPIVVVGGTTEDMGTAVLAAGDVNADDVVDLLDITDFAARYNDAVTNATDFDRSGAHDLLDFTALVDNLDLVGPTNWTN